MSIDERWGDKDHPWCDACLAYHHRNADNCPANAMRAIRRKRKPTVSGFLGRVIAFLVILAFVFFCLAMLVYAIRFFINAIGGIR